MAEDASTPALGDVLGDVDFDVKEAWQDAGSASWLGSIGDDLWSLITDNLTWILFFFALAAALHWFPRLIRVARWGRGSEGGD